MIFFLKKRGTSPSYDKHGSEMMLASKELTKGFDFQDKR